MSQEPAKDYLGHPCKFTEAKIRFGDKFHEAQQLDHRDIKRHLGKKLLELSERLDHASNVSHAICDMTETADDGQLHSLLKMFAAYELETTNIFYNFTGFVLAGLESIPVNAQGRD